MNKMSPTNRNITKRNDVEKRTDIFNLELHYNRDSLWFN